MTDYLKKGLAENDIVSEECKYNDIVKNNLLANDSSDGNISDSSNLCLSGEKRKLSIDSSSDDTTDTESTTSEFSDRDN